MKISLLVMLCIFLTSRVDASDGVLHLGTFSNSDLTGWKEQTIGLMKSKTSYNLKKDNDRTVLVAHSKKSASGQIYKLNLEPKVYSTLKWSWKIDHTIKKGDEKTKEGDDFPVRICVFFPRGFFSKDRAICYVWANKLPKGEHSASPFTKNIFTVAADSGEELAGRWTNHQRNMYEDYKSFFGEEPPRIGAIALMTDTDNTGESAVGYYGDISLVRAPVTTEVKLKDHKATETQQKEPKQREQTGKGIKNNGESSLPVPDIPKPVKIMNEPKPDELIDKEQPPGKTTTLPAAAPKPVIPQ
jgi:hypothetical protein